MLSCHIKNVQNLPHYFHLRETTTFPLPALNRISLSEKGNTSLHTVSDRFTLDTGSKTRGQVPTHGSPHPAVLPSLLPVWPCSLSPAGGMDDTANECLSVWKSSGPSLRDRITPDSWAWTHNSENSREGIQHPSDAVTPFIWNKSREQQQVGWHWS